MSGEKARVAPGRIRRFAAILIVLGAVCLLAGVALWASQPRNGYFVENNRDDEGYRSLDFVGRRFGLHNTVRTCAWESAPLEDSSGLWDIEGRRVATEATLQPDVLSSRLVYSLRAECIAPTVLSDSDYFDRERACGGNVNCVEFEHSQAMLRAQTIALRRVSFLDCRDYDGNPIENCSERGLLERHLQTELQRLQTDSSRSQADIEETARGLVRSCVVISGQVCRKKDEFVRSDWRVAVESPLSAVGWWVAITGLGMLLIGPLVWAAILQLARWVKG